MSWTLVCLCMVDSLTDDPHSVEVVLWQPLFGYVMNFSGSVSLNVLEWSLFVAHCRGECVRNRPWLISRHCSDIRLEGLRITRESRRGCLFYHVPAWQLLTGALLRSRLATTGNLQFVFTLKLTVEISKWSEFEADNGFACDKSAVLRDTVINARKLFALVPLKCSEFLDISTLKMRIVLSTDQELTSSRNAIDVHGQHHGECRVAAAHRGSIRTVPILSTRYSKCWCFHICAVVEESVSSSPVGPPAASNAHRASHHHPPEGIISWIARWLETSKSGYPVTRRRHYTVRPLRKPQNSRIRLFVRLRDPFLFSGDCSRRTKLNCHSTGYLEVVINQSS